MLRIKLIASMAAAMGGLLVLGCAPAATPAAPSAASIGAVPAADRMATLLFFSDAHADLEPHPELFWKDDGATEIATAGGYARLAHVVRAIRAETSGRALLIDGGDTFQGSAAAMWSRGEAVVAPQRALGVDLGIPGNWEVVYGPARMIELARETGYPWLATNVVDATSNKLVFAPTAVREVGGIRLGFVGFTDPDVPVRQSPAFSDGLRFLGPESIAPHVRALREEQHADVVVLVTHVGLARSVALAAEVQGVDLVLSGDTHERLSAPIVEHGVWVVEPGAFGSFLGRLEVHLGAGGRPTFAWNLLELRADRYPEDADVTVVVTESLAPYRGRMNRVVGSTSTSLERYGVVENTFDAIFVRALRERTGADVALSNGFRFGHPIAPGPITEGDLLRLYPVNGPIKVGKVSGAQLRAFWESEIEHVFSRDPAHLFGGWLPRVAGMTVKFHAAAPAGRHVTAITIGDKPLDDAATYTLASCEREGDTPDAVCRMRGVRETRVLDLDVYGVVRGYLADHSPVSASAPGAVVAEDLPSRVFSQYLRR
jgi:2',3'-cyclic-nucleotide 2'-phosphodiesterase (5'-nucleotidase family)